MEFQQLCELADREFTPGLAEEHLLAQAQQEAAGVPARVRELYWYFRATELNARVRRDGDGFLRELEARLGHQEKRRRSRQQRTRWFWALVCFAALLGTVTFPRLAVAAYPQRGFALFARAVLGAGCLALTVIAYTASRSHTDTD